MAGFWRSISTQESRMPGLWQTSDSTGCDHYSPFIQFHPSAPFARCLLCAVVGKLKCPVFIAHEVSGLVWVLGVGLWCGVWGGGGSVATPASPEVATEFLVVVLGRCDGNGR